MICSLPSSTVPLTGLLLTLLMVTTSCGDLQDPASDAVTPVTHLVGQPARPPDSSSGAHEPGPSAIDSTSSLGTQGTGQLSSEQTQGQSSQTTEEGMKSVTLGWDPSASQDVLGYRVHLVTVSSAVQQIIDVGSKTELALPLKIGESYGFTVTAYNASCESEALPYLLFQVL